MTKQKPTLVQFIADKRAEGKTDSEITHMLLDAGWHMDIIHKSMHGEPIKHRGLDPILDIKKQPLRKSALYGVALVVVIGLILLALFI